jgi:diaminopimelate epimerase
MKFAKYHALGNDYIVLPPSTLTAELTPDLLRAVCRRHHGVGSDGILLGPLPSRRADFGLRIFNPDGSEAQKSGNGLRIFARWLADQGLTPSPSFTVETVGGVVTCHTGLAAGLIRIDMGQVTFSSTALPIAGPERELLHEQLVLGGRPITFAAASIGNPHCVVLNERPSPALARSLGPQIETHPLFPQRTNVQFLEILDRANIRIEIWERGAGYTLASGSSSAAAAAVAHRLGFCDRQINVHMPGGRLQVQLTDEYHAALTGPVTKICAGMISIDEILNDN